MPQRPNRNYKDRLAQKAINSTAGNHFRRATRPTTRSRTHATDGCEPFIPPENWYEPVESGDAGYEIVRQEPGPGFRHIVQPREIRERLAELPDHMLEPLEVIQLSRMTRKKLSFPCYGMQWGCTVYLYPLEESLVERFSTAPMPTIRNEARMFGGRWVQRAGSCWDLIWTEKTIKDFYLNNVLIHELGHLLDDRNTRYIDRERYAEWFAIQHGYKTTSHQRPARHRVRRRHHSV